LAVLGIEREKSPTGEYVFMRDGERLQSFRKAWNIGL